MEWYCSCVGEKMKKIPLLLIAFLLALPVFVVAQAPMPVPVSGTVIVNGVAVDDYVVRVENVNTGEVLSYPAIESLKTDNGKYMFDLSSFKEGYFLRYNDYEGDTIRIEACSGYDACVWEFELVSSRNLIVDFDVAGDLPVTTCPENDCPVCETCPSCPDVQCPVTDNPDSIYNYLIGLGIAIAAFVGGFLSKRKWGTSENEDALLKSLSSRMSNYTGFRIVKWGGVVRVKHLHPGRSGYHDPNLGHRNPDWDHPKGKLIV